MGNWNTADLDAFSKAHNDGVAKPLTFRPTCCVFATIEVRYEPGGTIILVCGNCATELMRISVSGYVPCCTMTPPDLVCGGEFTVVVGRKQDGTLYGQSQSPVPPRDYWLWKAAGYLTHLACSTGATGLEDGCEQVIEEACEWRRKRADK